MMVNLRKNKGDGWEGSTQCVPYLEECAAGKCLALRKVLVRVELPERCRFFCLTRVSAILGLSVLRYRWKPCSPKFLKRKQPLFGGGLSGSAQGSWDAGSICPMFF